MLGSRTVWLGKGESVLTMKVNILWVVDKEFSELSLQE